MRRYAIGAAGLAALLALCGCGGREPTREELIERNQRLEGQLANVRNKLTDLETAASDLESAVGRLDDENWQEVVPDIRSASDEVVSAQDEAARAAVE